MAVKGRETVSCFISRNAPHLFLHLQRLLKVLPPRQVTQACGVVLFRCIMAVLELCWWRVCSVLTAGPSKMGKGCTARRRFPFTEWLTSLGWVFHFVTHRAPKNVIDSTTRCGISTSLMRDDIPESFNCEFICMQPRWDSKLRQAQMRLTCSTTRSSSP